jgi:hypothetical protein
LKRRESLDPNVLLRKLGVKHDEGQPVHGKLCDGVPVREFDTQSTNGERNSNRDQETGKLGRE